MRALSPRPTSAAAAGTSRFSRPVVSASRRSVDLAGRAVRLSPDVPVVFDAPLAPHHKVIGRWVAMRETSVRRKTRTEARRQIERVFDAAVLEILAPLQLADLRVVPLVGDDILPPALALICDSIGSLELGWIEKSNVLSQTLVGAVPPVKWRATAYKALGETLKSVLPIFGYDDLFEHIAAYYWEGETDDAAAVKAMLEWHGTDPNEIDEEMLPSAINARRPAWMIATNAGPLKALPAGLRDRICRLRAAHKAITSLKPDGNAWHFDFEEIGAYVSDYEDCSTLPPLTLVPFDHFARELDEVGRHGMETRFMDIVGLCLLSDADKVERWFTSLKLGVELLLAAQDLIDTDPVKP